MSTRIVDPGDYTIYRSVERPWVFITPDRLIMEGDKIVAPLELKTAHFAAAKVWLKECPVAYLCQMQLQMYVLGCDHAYVAVLIDGWAFRWHRAPRHQRFIDRLLKRIDHFWNHHVLGRVPPPLDYSKSTTEALARRYPTDNGAVVDLPVELEEKAARRAECERLLKELGEEKDLIDNELRAAIGEASYARLPGGSGMSWKANRNGVRTLRKTNKVPQEA